AFDGFNVRGWWNACGGEGGMNFRELVRVNIDVSRSLGLIQKPAHAAVATQRTNSLQLLRQIDCRCAVINTEQVTQRTANADRAMTDTEIQDRLSRFLQQDQGEVGRNVAAHMCHG